MSENVVSNTERGLPEEDRRERRRKERKAWVRPRREKQSTDERPTPGHRGVAIHSRRQQDEN